MSNEHTEWILWENEPENHRSPRLEAGMRKDLPDVRVEVGFNSTGMIVHVPVKDFQNWLRSCLAALEEIEK